MSIASDLFALQEIDLAIDQRERRLAEIEEDLQEPEALITARQALEDVRQQQSQLQAQQRDLDLQTSEVRDKASQLESKLYSGTVHSPKELQDLQEDMMSVRRQASAREDALLAIMVETEDMAAALAQAEEALRAEERIWDEARSHLVEEKSRIESELADLRTRRQGSSSDVDQPALQLYARLRDRRQGIAVARVERGMCQGCRISLPMSTLQKARSANNLVQCVSCERILYMS
ncbi:MAG TPA: C4-type zinc ribbon domain-containing protein [Dehalococcoidia bacterium]|nr:C4-type zinc ribbon domain-containing protein [Dehalococcoidia bacterium]